MMPNKKNEGRTREVAARGVKNLRDLANLESALMTDIMTGKISPSAANKLNAKLSKVLKKIK
jgi:hypothetical protein